MSSDKYEKISEMAKRRGYFWPSYEIYGGTGGFITFGPLGSILKRNIEDKFRKFLHNQINIFEIEASVITPEKVFEASGHVDNFKEPMVECKECKHTWTRSFTRKERSQRSNPTKT